MMGQVTEVLLNGAMYRRYVNQRLTHVYERYDLNPADVKVILFLKQCGKDEDRMCDIVRKAAVNKGLISQSVTKLAKRGMLNLHADAGDRRVRHISLTENAEPVVHDLQSVYEAIHREVFEGIDPEEMRAFSSVTRKIIENLNHVALSEEE